MRTTRARGPHANRRATETSPARGAQDPWCPGCRTTDHLVFESAVPRVDAAGLQDTTWDVEYWCARCDGYFGHETAHLPAAAAALSAGVVYVHCGQPMSPAANEPRTIGADGDAPGPSLPAVALDAQLWQCRCGFVLAVPDLDET